MLKLIVSAVLVSVAFAQPRPCCTPMQWEGFGGTITGTVAMGNAMISEVGLQISYDQMAMKIALTLSGKMPNGQDFQNKTILDYQDKLIYKINNGRCTVSPLQMEFKPLCVPADAMMLKPTFTLGVGVNSLKVNAWTFMQNDIKSIATLTADMCIPIDEVSFGSAGSTKILSVAGFGDITLGIKDDKVFMPPGNCQPVMGSDRPMGLLGLPDSDHE